MTSEQQAPFGAQTDRRPRRALILAGGGVKVAFQAGVLQVWLDELDIEFDHVDAASGGVFNLAMMCQGYSGNEVADAWRRFNPLDGISINWSQLWRTSLFAESILTYERFKRNVFRSWGLDFSRIQASELSAAFNVYNFSKHRLEVLSPEQITPEMLVACVSLPMWFPPVDHDGMRYIDSVYMTDANLEDAIIRHGADELWIIWTVSDRSEWHAGFHANYFQVIETSAVGRFHQILDRIEANNEAVAQGEHGEFGRPITVHMLKEEVQLNYLLNLSADRNVEAVNKGVDIARTWAQERGHHPRQTPPPEPPPATQPATTLRFTETMSGWVGLGETVPESGQRTGQRDRTRLTFRLTIHIDDIATFIHSPHHEASATGWVDFDPLGGRLPVEQATFHLFDTEGDELHKRMRYRLFVRDSDGSPYTVAGEKLIEVDRGRHVWRDTTTLFTRVYRGHVERAAEADELPIGAGVVRISPLSFLRQLTTFRVGAPTFGKRLRGLLRFGLFFSGRLWDIYARPILPWAPF